MLQRQLVVPTDRRIFAVFRALRARLERRSACTI